jgi:hypothetical protein
MVEPSHEPEAPGPSVAEPDTEPPTGCHSNLPYTCELRPSLICARNCGVALEMNGRVAPVAQTVSGAVA